MSSRRWRTFSAYRDPFFVTRMQRRLASADESVGHTYRSPEDVWHEPLLAMAFGPQGGVVMWTHREVLVLTRDHVMETLRSLPRDPPPGGPPPEGSVFVRHGWHDLLIDGVRDGTTFDREARLACEAFTPVTLAQADTCFASSDGPPPREPRQDRVRILASELETVARCERFTIGPTGYQVGWTDDLVFCVHARTSGERVLVMPRHLPPESHFPVQFETSAAPAEG